jgi:hypothetical protein
MDKRSGDTDLLLAPLTGYFYEFEVDCSLEAYVVALRDKITASPQLGIQFLAEEADSRQFVLQVGGPYRTSTGYLKAISASATLVSGKMSNDRAVIYAFLVLLTLFFVLGLLRKLPFNALTLSCLLGFVVLVYLFWIVIYRNWTSYALRVLREVC